MDGNEPSAFRFSQILRALVERRDSKGVIQLVERWLEHGTVSQTARLAQARALIDLRLMDRAWVRLREAATADPSSVEVQLLTAQMFVDRGWPSKASKVLDRVAVGRASSAERRRFSELKVAAEGEPNGPPSNAQAIEQEGTAAEVLALAETYMAVSMWVRAESLLERLVRDGGKSDRVSDLLWALRGEFDNPQVSTDALLERLSMPSAAPEWGILEHTDGLGPVEVTAFAGDSEVVEEQGVEKRRRAFPSLFRRNEAPAETTEVTADEVTMSSLIVDEDGCTDGLEITDTEATSGTEGGDTKIMEVIQRDGQLSLSEVSGRIHKPSPTRAVDSSVQLGGGLAPDDDTYLEEEDKDLIVMTRREPVAAPHRASRERKRVQVQNRNKVPEMVRVPKSASLVALVEKDADTDDAIAQSKTPQSRTRQVAVSLAAVLGLIAVCAWVVVNVLHWIAAGQIIEETHRTIVAEDFRALQELEAKLSGQIALKRAPLAVRHVELALVQVELWRRYTGDAERLLAVQEGLSLARTARAPTEEVQLVDATLSLAMGNLTRARILVDKMPLDEPLQRVLATQLALKLRTEKESMEVLERLGGLAPTASVLERLSRASLYAAVDNAERALPLREHLLADHPSSAFVQVVRFREGWDEFSVDEALAQLADVMETLPGPVAPRQEAALHAERARLLEEQGEHTMAEESWSAALLLDPSHPKYLFFSASKRLRSNKVLGALDDLDRCLGSSPWDFACRRGMIQTLIALDRLETARQSVDAWRDNRTSALSAWVTLAEGRPKVAIGELEGVDGTLAAYVRGMALFELGSEKSTPMLQQVVDVWGGISDPMTEILVGRARAGIILQQKTPIEAEQMVAIADLEDPIIGVMIAHALERAKQRVSAGRWYERSAEIGSENAIALHSLGLFWFEPQGDISVARRIWRSYLDLQPNGDRARRTRARMGRR